MKKVAVVNRTNLKNYGSVLQVYALCEAVREMGYDSEIIWEKGTLSKNYDFRPNKIISTGIKLLTHPKLLKSTFSSVKYVQQHVISEETVRLFDEFVNQTVRRKFYPPKMMNKRKVGSMYDKFICGSDQVWCTTTTYVDPLMYLRFAPQEKRIAYAPSLGRDYIPDYNAKQMKRYINEIPNVSVREATGQKLIKELTGRDVSVVADPTLIVSKEKWDAIKIESNLGNDYILCYFLSTPTEETQRKLLKVLKTAGKKVVALNSRLEYLEKDLDICYPDCGPREFIGYISKANAVLTDSYHGMLFSMIYQRQFWSVEREYGEFDQSSRQLTILEKFGILDRYIKTNEAVNLGDNTLDYAMISERLQAFRDISLNYLREALA